MNTATFIAAAGVDPYVKAEEVISARPGEVQALGEAFEQAAAALSESGSLDSYGDVPSFTTNGTDSGFFSRRYSVTNNWSALSGVGLSSNIVNRYGSLGSYTTEGAQYGYTFKSGVSFYGGFDTLKYNPGLGGPFATFDGRSTSTPAYAINGGVEFKPTSNISLSLGFSYAGQSSDRIDSDINSPALPGATPQAFTSGRR